MLDRLYEGLIMITAGAAVTAVANQKVPEVLLCMGRRGMSI
jgi:hypothetical protein